MRPEHLQAVHSQEAQDWMDRLKLEARCQSHRTLQELELVTLAYRDGLVTTIATLPTHLRRSLTWDQGTEMARHREVTLATDMAIYFCDPHSPWQRGSNENTNGLLRQYFPKGTNLNAHSAERLLEVATELNQRPRKTLDGITPATALEKLLSNPPEPPVATTA